jgi:hypothetical protein
MILTRPPEYNMEVQVRIPPALCAIHNFIRVHDEEEIHDFDEVVSSNQNEDCGYGVLSHGPANRAERDQAAIKRDLIAEAMWVDYQRVLAQRA